MTEKPRVSDIELGAILGGAANVINNVRFGKTTLYNALLDLQDARAEIAEHKRHVSTVMKRESGLRERVRELEDELHRKSNAYDWACFERRDLRRQLNALRQAVSVAVNHYCSCGGRGPEDEYVCDVCMVYHKVEQMSGGGESRNAGQKTFSSHRRAALNQQDDAGGHVGNTGAHTESGKDGMSEPPRPAPSSSLIGQLLVRDGVPRRNVVYETLYEHPLTNDYIEYDGKFYHVITDSPADLPYKLAWGAAKPPLIAALEKAGGDETPSAIGGHARKPWRLPDGLYDVWRVESCRYFSDGGDGNDFADQCRGGQLVHPYSNGDSPLYKTCPTCQGDGGRYELRGAAE